MKRILISLFLISYIINPLLCQKSPNYQITDFFKIITYPKDDSFGFYIDLDSLKNTSLSDFGSNMWAFNQYLYSNYSVAARNNKKLSELVPDSDAIFSEFNNMLLSDTLFQELFFSIVERRKVPDIHIDSIQRIASRFFYLHRLSNDEIVLHMCAEINEVLALKQNEASPFYNAFCYMVIRNFSACGDEWNSIDDEISVDYNKLTDDSEIEKMKNKIYSNLMHSEAYRQNIINEYERRKDYLNFKLIY